MNVVAPINTYDILSAIDTSVLCDIKAHNISAWYDISMMGYDAGIVLL